MRKFLIRIIKVAMLVFALLGSYIAIATPFQEINNLPNVISITYDGINELNKERPFGKFVSFGYDDSIDVSTYNNNNEVSIKLLNIITLKKMKIGLNSTEVYAGGDTVGFSLNSKGVVLIGHSDIITKDGKVDTLKDSKLSVGDVILKINDVDIDRVSDINKVLNDIKEDVSSLKVLASRNNQEFETIISPALDVFTDSYKLGIWVKDETSGVGTLTYVKKDDGAFGALGHAICDSETSVPFEVNNGDMYPCTILGVKKGAKGKPGEIKALFLQKNPIGQVEYNSKFGLFGHMDINNSFLQDKEIFSTGGRLTARAGKAKIRSDISGELKDYDIEIIKTNYQTSTSEKSMVIKVVDKELLKLTGGIVQGMSGSPIIQNGKIIGAVTHVFVNDPSKGFGIYLDWMING